MEIYYQEIHYIFGISVKFSNEYFHINRIIVIIVIVVCRRFAAMPFGAMVAGATGGWTFPLTEVIMKKVFFNEHCMGFSECSNNCRDFSIFSTDPAQDDLTQEYWAGYVQGGLQGADMITAARNNTWRNTYLCDPSHSFPKELEPSEQELEEAAGVLNENYRYLYGWLAANADGDKDSVAHHIKRLLYRMLGIYDGATKDAPQVPVKVRQSGDRGGICRFFR